MFQAPNQENLYLFFPKNFFLKNLSFFIWLLVITLFEDFLDFLDGSSGAKVYARAPQSSSNESSYPECVVYSPDSL